MAAAASNPTENTAFSFVSMLATELSVGKIDLPSFPDIAFRVRRVLQDEDVSPDKVTRVVGVEPALVARLLQLSNSASINVSGKRITDLRLAIARIGFNLVRSSAIAFAMSQLSKAEGLKSVREPLRSLWQHSALVAAMASVVAKRLTRVNADTAALAGILHGIGKLYLLVRSVEYPALFSSPEVYGGIEKQWHANIAKAVLENWQMAEEVVTAVHLQEDLEYSHEGETDLTDVLLIANLLVEFRERPDDIGLHLHGVKSASRMQLDEVIFKKLLVESRAEIESLRAALGG